MIGTHSLGGPLRVWDYQNFIISQLLGQVYHDSMMLVPTSHRQAKLLSLRDEGLKQTSCVNANTLEGNSPADKRYSW